jgi:hypothetical protein
LLALQATKMTKVTKMTVSARSENGHLDPSSTAFVVIAQKKVVERVIATPTRADRMKHRQFWGGRQGAGRRGRDCEPESFDLERV